MQRTRRCFGGWGNPATSNPSVLGKVGGVANTNIVCHAADCSPWGKAFDPQMLEAQGSAQHAS